MDDTLSRRSLLTGVAATAGAAIRDKRARERSGHHRDYSPGTKNSAHQLMLHPYGHAFGVRVGYGPTERGMADRRYHGLD